MFVDGLAPHENKLDFWTKNGTFSQSGFNSGLQRNDAKVQHYFHSAINH